jgi:hypothetical protein
MEKPVGPLLKFTAAGLLIALMVKAIGRFDPGGDPASYYDIARELALCAFLASLILHLRSDTALMQVMNHASLRRLKT